MNAQLYGNPAHILPPQWTSVINSWLVEDTPSFDYGGFVVGEDIEEAKLYGKSKGILAGVPFFDEIFKQVGCTVTWHLKEGDIVAGNKTVVATVRGPARCLLLGERVGLNVLARCSGIATQSRKFLDIARSNSYKGIVAGTRKTTPGFRLVEKYGMLIGGVDPHRYDLSSMVMLKDNHIWSKGSIRQAVYSARSVAGFSLRIDVEVSNEKDAIEAIEAGADVVMLDNFSPEQIQISAESLKKKYKGSDRRFLIEVSGGLNEQNIGSHLCEHVDIYSTSNVHQGTSIVDFSLKIIPKNNKE
ncbi:nicotinate-nucleotide diphosphorylase [Phakopsora pachyrhizi]|uniref:Nicotinate-nucleotide pyrophosphorylase [carboxylating] n=1 Tax=Phakopsora pachyrhizi TaxID=170000 RepID=A0AAV0BTF7_PHAPC|nr:nicotinate-nucleotide diphosphorylase [Phakopsora pachyrhizi]CAH7689523.1 nicotinate-nucleotide diphosphorylase [Phakopsora pachyrhizi]